MDAEEFVSGIKSNVEKGSLEGVLSALKKPPGRSPSKNLIELSRWFLDLSTDDQKNVERVMQMSIEVATFSLFAILDGVSFIEGYGEKGDFELWYTKGNERVLLNDRKKEFLHDIYRGTLPD